VNDIKDHQDSGRSPGAAHRGEWVGLNAARPDVPGPAAALNSYDVTLRGPVVDALRILLSEYDAPAHTVLRDLRLDPPGLRRLLDRARALGMEVVEIRPTRAGGGRHGG
jgi:hypothetical protein